MKYWVYKESRILGPFNKEVMSGLPGLDSGTLVCSGDPDGGTWTPAGELADLTELPLTGAAADDFDEFSSEIGLLDRLQIDAAGLVGDDEFPGALAEDLFQDADLKRSFDDVLSVSGPSKESELRRSRDQVCELTSSLEILYRRISELEAGQTDLTHRLAEKDLELRRRGTAPSIGPPPPDWPEIPSSGGIPAPLVSEPPAPRKTPSFGKPKSFKIVPAIRSFKVVDSGAGEQPSASAAPAPALDSPDVSIAPVSQIALVPTLEPEPPLVVATPAPVPLPASAAVPMPTSLPPNTLSRGIPVMDMTASDDGDREGATAPVPDAVLARFAKPELETVLATDEPSERARNNKPFAILGVVVVILLLAVGFIFMRQPKDDLKHMAALDGGKSSISLPNIEEGNASAPPVSSEHETAIAMVKDFPLDGGRGTVGRWLQYSYTASPDAGAEEWNASTTGDKTVLVEYRLVPGPKGGSAALYLFEADVARGLVMGKNLEARRMLAGGPPPEATEAKKRPTSKKVKRAAKKPAAVREPKEVPLLPLPDLGELRPPSAGDAAFGL